MNMVCYLYKNTGKEEFWVDALIHVCKTDIENTNIYKKHTEMRFFFFSKKTKFKN